MQSSRERRRRRLCDDRRDGRRRRRLRPLRLRGGPRPPRRRRSMNSVLAEHVDQLGFEQTADRRGVRGQRRRRPGGNRAPGAVRRAPGASRDRASAEEFLDARRPRPPVKARRRARIVCAGRGAGRRRGGGRTRRRLPAKTCFPRAFGRPAPRTSTGEHVTDAVNGDDAARL